MCLRCENNEAQMVPKAHQFWYSRVFGMTLTKKAFKVTSLLFVLFARSAYGQSSLSLDSAAILKGTTASLNLSLNAPAGSEPASLQWKISYPLTDITALNIVAGPGLTNAAKTLSCGASAGSVSCMATGMNTNTIANDVVAVVTVTVASGTINSSDVLLFAGLMGAFPDGTLASVTGTGGTLTLLNPVPTDRKSTRLNSSHGYISYAVFCLKKKLDPARDVCARRVAHREPSGRG